MHDAAMAVAAFAREVPAFGHGLAGIERHAQFRQPVDRGRCIAGDIFNRGAVVEPGTGHHCVFHMRRNRIAGIQHGGDPALCPGRGTIGEIALG